jgi:hypothetical protein
VSGAASGPVDHIREVGAVAKALSNLGLQPVLIGGMALVMLGSRRVTRDFDFVVSQPGDRLGQLLDLLYDRKFELVSRLDESGNVTATISNRKVASIRLRLDTPASAYFVRPGTSLRIDLLFDFPITAATLAKRASRTKVRSHVFYIASEQDLLQLKRLAKAQRSAPGDAEDIAFLEARQKR